MVDNENCSVDGAYHSLYSLTFKNFMRIDFPAF